MPQPDPRRWRPLCAPPSPGRTLRCCGVPGRCATVADVLVAGRQVGRAVMAEVGESRPESAVGRAGAGAVLDQVVVAGGELGAGAWVEAGEQVARERVGGAGAGGA